MRVSGRVDGDSMENRRRTSLSRLRHACTSRFEGSTLDASWKSGQGVDKEKPERRQEKMPTMLCFNEQSLTGLASRLAARNQCLCDIIIREAGCPEVHV